MISIKHIQGMTAFWFRKTISLVGALAISSCASHSNLVPPKIYFGDEAAAAYLAPKHRELLERAAERSPEAAQLLLAYYQFCVHDNSQVKFWAKRAADLKATGHESLTTEEKPKVLSPNELMDLVERAQAGNATAARRIAESYWVIYGSAAHALPWMELAEKNGDTAAKSYVVRLRAELGLIRFSAPNGKQTP
jgi:hypothetical protein